MVHLACFCSVRKFMFQYAVVSRHAVTYPCISEFVVHIGVAILVKPKYAGSSASLRVAADPVAKFGKR